MKNVREIVAAALFAAACMNQAHAQVVPVVVTKDIDVVKQWYERQQWIHEAKTALSDYQQFQYARENFQKYHIGGLVDMMSPLLRLQHDIESAMHNGQDPQLAAELRRNKWLLQDAATIDKLKRLSDSAKGNSQIQAVTNLLLSALASDQMQQREIDYAKAQQEMQKEKLWQQFNDANAADTIQ